jgi:NAD(P)-dependent dehydrogenase (short-subunit alcohol dehydrogenase family)
MDVDGAVVLVTGANRGLGKAFVRGLLDRGAATVYAGARDPGTVVVDDPRVVPVALDITDAAAVARVAADHPDVTLVVNNAGISTVTSLLTGPLDDVHRELDTNFYGTLAVTRAFAPVLAANGGGALVNVLSVLSWFSMPVTGAYCASKAASWSATNSLRVELRPQGTQVVAVHVGYLDTDMAAQVDEPKTDPATAVALTLDALEAGASEVLVDEISRAVQAGLAGGVDALYPEPAPAA